MFIAADWFESEMSTGIFMTWLIYYQWINAYSKTGIPHSITSFYACKTLTAIVHAERYFSYDIKFLFKRIVCPVFLMNYCPQVLIDFNLKSKISKLSNT